jgi:hypothetical protein
LATQILKGEAAFDALIARELPDWQARKVLATARQLGVNNIPVDGGRDVLGVRYEGGYFYIGDPDFLLGSR